ncbi:hypothetical protein OnM2_034046 [Erysiphe neolycopersici]|uniref:Uncharacterized protein n=1 Tax=Erysiphe neolycopersici TaxID=212602 RepID=A0A420HY57_9PEZI|nr:hypothetical protein OnM2_034046 [Erysiphe neolycopersici]
MVGSCNFRKRKQSEIEGSNQAQTRAPKSSKIDKMPVSQIMQESCEDFTSNLLTENNLIELDKINIKNRNRTKFESCMSKTEEVQSLTQLAREGGPDLTDLIGYIDDYSDLMSESLSQSTTTERTFLSQSKIRKTLIDSGIFQYEFFDPKSKAHTPKPGNLDEMRARALRARPASEFIEDYRQFHIADLDSFDDEDIINSVVPLIEGDNIDSGLNRYKVLFSNLDPLVEGIPTARPDSFWGASRTVVWQHKHRTKFLPRGGWSK